MNFTKKSLKSFTLTELMVVVLIIAILASFVVVVFSGSLKRSKDNRMISDVQVVSNALDQYSQANMRKFPLNIATATKGYTIYDINTLLGNSAFKNYVNNISIDPAYKVQYVVKKDGLKAMLVIPKENLYKQTNSQCAGSNTTASANDYFNKTEFYSPGLVIFSRAQICQLIVK